MGFWSDLVFGRPVQRTFRDERIGEWKTTVRRDKRGKWCLWEAQRLLDAHEQETYFELSGDSSGPDPALLEQVHRVLSNLGSIMEIVDKEIRASAARGSIADFFVSRIGDWDANDRILQIDFAPVGERILDREKLIFWPGDTPELDHRVVVHAIDVRIQPGQLVKRGLA